jgi:hypothetical protein
MGKNIDVVGLTDHVHRPGRRTWVVGPLRRGDRPPPTRRVIDRLEKMDNRPPFVFAPIRKTINRSSKMSKPTQQGNPFHHTPHGAIPAASPHTLARRTDPEAAKTNGSEVTNNESPRSAP